MDSKSRIEAFKRIINEIKRVTKEKDLTRSDNQLIKDLMRVLQFEIEFRLLQDAYSRNQDFNKIIPNIKTIYNNYYNELQALEEKKSLGALQGIEEYRYKRLFFATNRLQRLIDMVENREFNHYISSMAIVLDESDQIIEVCGNILKSGIDDFNNLFGTNVTSQDEQGHGVIDTETVDSIYSILSHPDSVKEAEGFFRSYRNSHIDELTQKQEVDEKFLEYLNIIQSNLDLFREYMKLLRYSGKKSQIELDSCEARISNLKLELHDLDSSVLNVLRKSGRRNAIMQEIDRNEGIITNINTNREKVAEMEAKITDLGCEGLLNALNTSISELEDTPEAKVALMLKPLSNISFDMSKYITVISNEIAEIKDELQGKQGIVDDKLANINNPDLRKALKNYPDDVMKILKMKNYHFGATNEQEKEHITPYLAALCLKAIQDSKNLTTDEINQASLSALTSGVASRIEADNGIVANCLRNIDLAISEIVNRAPYDPKDYNAIVLS